MIDTEALRSKILDLAIRGKLTEQLPEDGSAEDLYAKIQEEKAQLVKEGKIKKEKTLPDITEDEIPFEIPKNWKWVRLNDVGSWSAGATPSRGNKDYYENGIIPWIKTGELHDEYIDTAEEWITEAALQECSIRLNPVGSVLIAMYGATIGKLGILNIAAATNQACCACIPVILDKRYLFYFLKSNKERFLDASHGGAQPNISKDIITKAVMPLPPLAEQKRIIDKVNDILKRIDEIENLQSQYATNVEALKSKLIDAGICGKLTEQLPEDGDAEDLYNQIQDEKARLIKEGKIKKEKTLPDITEDEIPFEIPKNWKWVRLNDVGSWSAGATPSRGNNDYYENGIIPWIKTGELHDGYIDTAEEWITEAALQECSIRLNPVGSVLIAMYGATIGKLGILNIAAATNQACCACIPVILDKRYLFYFLKSNKERFLDASHGGAQPNISKDIITKAVMPLPPLAEQKRLIERLDVLMEQL